MNPERYVSARTRKLSKCVALWPAFTLHSHFLSIYSHFYVVEDNTNINMVGESLSRLLHSIDGAFPDSTVVLA